MKLIQVHKAHGNLRISCPLQIQTAKDTVRLSLGSPRMKPTIRTRTRIFPAKTGNAIP